MNFFIIKVENFLQSNTEMIDKLFLLKLKLYIFKLLRLRKQVSVGKFNQVIYEIDYMIHEQKEDRDFILKIIEEFEILKKQNDELGLWRLKKYVDPYLDDLIHSLSLNKIYFSQVNDFFSRPTFENYPSLMFENLLKARKDIENKKFVLMNKKRSK